MLKVKRRLRCPDCNNTREFNLIEIWAGFTVEFVYKQGDVAPFGNMDYGDPTHVEAECPYCGKRWKLRGVTQITDLGEDDAEG